MQTDEKANIKFGTLVEAVAHWAEQTPDKVCLIDADIDREMTYGEFWLAIRVFAKRLIDAGLRKGDRVVVRVGALHETFVAQFGIYLAGGVYCPVEKHMKELKMLEMLDYYDCTLYISTEKIETDAAFVDLTTVCDEGKPLENFDFPNPEEMCAIVFTTGTTGKAKGVMHCYKAILLYGIARKDACGYRDNDTYLWTNPIDRVNGVHTFGAVFIVGGTSVHMSGFIFIEGLFNTIRKYRVTALYLQSFMLILLWENAPMSLSEFQEQLRIVILSGGMISETDRTRIKALLPNTKLFIFYGATEALAITALEFSLYNGNPNCVCSCSSATAYYGRCCGTFLTG